MADMIESTDVTCVDCDLPAFRDGFVFWCPACDKQVEIVVPL